ncbi:MAG: hypothetical protein ACI361_07745 [Atopobiaceae bacterium]
MAGSSRNAEESVVVTEHVRSNLGWAAGVAASGAVTIWLLLFPLFSSSVWLVWIRWIGIPLVAAFEVMALIQVLNYFNRRLEVSDAGVVYTNCLRRTRSYSWSNVIAYDIRKKSHALELVLAGHPRTFHESSTNFDAFVDCVMDHTELIALSDR